MNDLGILRLLQLLHFYADATSDVFPDNHQALSTSMLLATADDFFLICAVKGENGTSDMCVHRRLRSACASAQSDQSIRGMLYV